MSERHDGGPAFPVSGGFVEGPNSHIWTEPDPGMSLRDYFAAQALQGLIAGCYAGDVKAFTLEGNVFAAYQYADAMLEARKP